MKARLLALVIVISLRSVAACADAAPPVAPRPVAHTHTARLTITSVGANPLNALSSVVSFDAGAADSARVLYWSDADAPAATPFYRVRGAARIVTLGLRPATTYSHVVEVLQGGVATRSDTVVLQSGALPDFLQTVHLAVTGALSGGYSLTALVDGTTAYVVALDSVGQVRWYRELDDAFGTQETKQQPNGDFTVYVGQSHGYDQFRGNYVQFTATGDLVSTITAPDSMYTDPHELQLTFADTTLTGAYFFAYDYRHVDLSPYGGPSDTLLAGHQLLRASGTSAAPEVLWNDWDHYDLADWIEPPRTLGDFDHPNSIDFDRDGNYVVSFRNLGEITDIDAGTGTMRWRLGGAHNQFTFVNDPLGGFSAQHSVRVLPNGDLLIFDNGWRHDPQASRIVEYRLNTRAMTATLVWEYSHAPSLFNQFTGSAQRLANGNTVAGFSALGIETEVRPDGSVAGEGTLAAGSQQAASVYRFTRIASLYRWKRP